MNLLQHHLHWPTRIISALVWFLFWLQLSVLLLQTTAWAAEAATDFTGYTCDELTPDLCDLNVATGRIPISEDGLLVKYWKYSSKQANTSTIDAKFPAPSPIIVVHGGPGETHNYMLPLKQLACRPDSHGRTRDVYFYDQAGCGESIVPVKDIDRNIVIYNKTQYMSQLVNEYPFLLDPQYYATVELPRIVQALGLETYHVVANSWGTILTQYFVLNTDAQDRGLLSLTLSGALSDGDLYVQSQWSTDGDHNLGELPVFIQQRIHTLEQSHQYESAEYQAINDVLTGRFTLRTRPFPDCFLAIADGTNRDIYVGLQGSSEFTFGGVLQHFNTTPRLHSIHVPTLLTSGQYDTMRPPVVDTLYRQIPKCEWHMFNHSGHISMIDDAGPMNDAIDDFLERVEEASGVDAFLTQLRESSQARNDHVKISSFAPRPELCGPPGCLPKQEQQQAEDPGESFHQSTTGSYVTQEGYSMWVIGGVFLAGFFTGRGFSPNQRQSRFEGYESI